MNHSALAVAFVSSFHSVHRPRPSNQISFPAGENRLSIQFMSAPFLKAGSWGRGIGGEGLSGGPTQARRMSSVNTVMVMVYDKTPEEAVAEMENQEEATHIIVNGSSLHDPEVMAEFFSLLTRSFDTLKALRISANEVFCSSPKFPELLDLIHQATALTELSLESCKIDAPKLQLLREKIPPVKELGLGCNPLGEEGLELIAKMVAENPKIESVQLAGVTGVKKDGKGMAAIERVVRGDGGAQTALMSLGFAPEIIPASLEQKLDVNNTMSKLREVKAGRVTGFGSNQFNYTVKVSASSRAFELFLDTMSTATQWTSILADEIGLTPTTAPKLAAACKEGGACEWLRLTGNSEMTSDGLKGLIPVFEMRSMKKVHLENCGLTSIICLKDALSKPECTVTQLNIGDNPLGDSGATELAEVLMTNKSLITVDVGNAGITEAGAQRLSQALTKCPGDVKGVYFSSTDSKVVSNIVKNGVVRKALVKSLKGGVSGPGLLSVNVPLDEESFPGGLELLCEYLAGPTSNEVKLTGSALGESPLVKVAEALGSNTTALSLSLAGLKVGSALGPLVDAILRSKIEVLDLVRCGITDGAPILKLLQESKTLEVLHLSGNKFEPPFARDLASVLEKKERQSQSLSQLHMVKCGIDYNSDEGIALNRAAGAAGIVVVGSETCKLNGEAAQEWLCGKGDYKMYIIDDLGYEGMYGSQPLMLVRDRSHLAPIILSHLSSLRTAGTRASFQDPIWEDFVETHGVISYRGGLGSSSSLTYEVERALRRESPETIIHMFGNVIVDKEGMPWHKLREITPQDFVLRNDMTLPALYDVFTRRPDNRSVFQTVKELVDASEDRSVLSDDGQAPQFDGKPINLFQVCRQDGKGLSQNRFIAANSIGDVVKLMALPENETLFEKDLDIMLMDPSGRRSGRPEVGSDACGPWPEWSLDVWREFIASQPPEELTKMFTYCYSTDNLKSVSIVPVSQCFVDNAPVAKPWPLSQPSSKVAAGPRLDPDVYVHAYRLIEQSGLVWWWNQYQERLVEFIKKHRGTVSPSSWMGAWEKKEKSWRYVVTAPGSTERLNSILPIIKAVGNHLDITNGKLDEETFVLINENPLRYSSMTF